MPLIIEPDDLTLGRGFLTFAKYAEGQTFNPEYLRFGNTPEFSLSVETEELDHYSSDKGIREKDEQFTIETTRTGSIIVDNMASENIALFFLGETSTVAVAAQATQQDVFTSISKGAVYQLGVSAASPAGVSGVTLTSVTGATGSPTYVEGTDYTVEADLGFITVLLTGSIADASDIEVNYDIRASTRTRVISGQASAVGSLRFQQCNPKGPNRLYTFPKCRIMPGGDFALKGDEWQQMPFNIEALVPVPGEPAVLIDKAPVFT